MGDIRFSFLFAPLWHRLAVYDIIMLRYEVTENIKMNLLAAAELDSTGDVREERSGGENRRHRGYWFNCIGLGQYELLLGGAECNEGGEYGLDGSSINIDGDSSWQQHEEDEERVSDRPMSTIVEGSVDSLADSLHRVER
ncbi:hypothetical protein Pmar_PMAR007134 [Perkinsus marinus ATCC 50983]|uniref:Uncharacterized protein n=1 Tax=Perkinsus marinus (strain ATCC 50983 / TXsc) TaxID=423536 RepID=C5KQA9_PERM5|nr:hypothetical protein Pmar_PMAR007134 [Perkinsus marinus ATCC 50983]EER13331.1 hypothetical protein Pmar_PMAR007134 [Perkinsus marinus ATCC 50983]|eukprot:XP_002781536.1 hypothetical protein Pmar_PMAR007134 [Perkinsus marinus ATCC 50983]